MDVNTEKVWEYKLNRLVENLRANQLEPFIAKNTEDLLRLIDDLILPGSTVCSGGSMTLRETGVLDAIRNREDIVFFDREQIKESGKSARKDACRQAFSSDYYLTSTNAITEEGWLYNVDGTGNRVAAMLFGPQNVIVVCGRNKIVPTVEEADRRAHHIAAPPNCVRLGRKTPCASSGFCSDCTTSDRICNVYTIIKRQNQKGRIKVILLNFEAGY